MYGGQSGSTQDPTFWKGSLELVLTHCGVGWPLKLRQSDGLLSVRLRCWNALEESTEGVEGGQDRMDLLLEDPPADCHPPRRAQKTLPSQSNKGHTSERSSVLAGRCCLGMPGPLSKDTLRFRRGRGHIEPCNHQRQCRHKA